MSASAPRRSSATPNVPAPSAREPLRGEIQSPTIPNLFHDLAAGRATGVLIPRRPRAVRHLEQPRRPLQPASDMGDFHVCRAVWGLLIVGALMKS
jgi:hypothetical protein